MGGGGGGRHITQNVPIGEEGFNSATQDKYCSFEKNKLLILKKLK
jgi:acetyl/propionyl-CoA carboxylase alpha subunit